VGRPRNPTAERPPCPLGHAGRVLLNGYYGQTGHYRRPRYKCYPSAGGKPHPFQLPLGRRQPTPDHPHGPSCQDCGHLVARHEGAETARRYFYSTRDIADMLVELGRGTSLRKASAAARRSTARLTRDQYGNRRVSYHAQLAINQLAVFGPVVTDALLPQTWPRSVVLDGTPFLRRTTYDDGAPRQGGPIGFALYAAYGYTGGKGTGLLWRMDMRGANDNIEWAEFLRSLATDEAAPPDWVVTDGSGAIQRAVKQVWPKATLYVCEAHLLRRGEKILAKDHIYGGHELFDLWRQAQWSRERWQTFLDALESSKADNMRSWTAKKRALIERQFDIRLPERPRSTGALETALANTKKLIGTRHYVFRNAARLRLLLGLVTLHEREEADPRVYAEVIRKALVANGGKAPARARALNDPKAVPSIAAEAALAEARLGDKRKKAREHSRKFEAQEAIKRQERRTVGHLKSGRELPAEPTAPTPPEPEQQLLDLE